jgi:hypothetical protein
MAPPALVLAGLPPPTLVLGPTGARFCLPALVLAGEAPVSYALPSPSFVSVSNT